MTLPFEFHMPMKKLLIDTRCHYILHSASNGTFIFLKSCYLPDWIRPMATFQQDDINLSLEITPSSYNPLHMLVIEVI